MVVTMSNTISRTIPFMWIVFFNDGSCLPQFDLETGEQHSFKLVQEAELDGKLTKFGLFPVTFELSKKIGPQYYFDGKLSHFILKLGPNQRLIGGIRREAQRFFSYSHCLKCGFKWQWMPNHKDQEIGEAGLPIYGNEESYYSVMQPNGKAALEVICPKCGARNDLKCPKCDKWWNKIDEKYTLQCPECKAIKEKRIQPSDDHTIENIFLLGWQETLPDNTNKKMIMFINTKGEFEISDNYNFR